MTAKSDLLIEELVAACIAFGRQVEPNWQTRIDKAQSALKAHIEELEVETETVAGDYEDRMDNLINMGNETGRLLQSEIGYLNAQLNIKNETTKFLQLRIAELEAAQRWHVVADGELPIVGKSIMFYDSSSEEIYRGVYTASHHWRANYFSEKCGTVTHWMPLPNPPEVK
jgi:hypothetical protein